MKALTAVAAAVEAAVVIWAVRRWLRVPPPASHADEVETSLTELRRRRGLA